MALATVHDEIYEMPAYTLDEASMLLGLSQQMIRAWIKDTRRHKSVISSTNAALPSPSFLDVVELRVVAMMLKSLKRRDVASVYEWVQRRFNVSRPFAFEPVYVLGRGVFMHEPDEPRYLVETRTKGQLAIPSIVLEAAETIDPGEIRSIGEREMDFNASTLLANHWWPMTKTSQVVVDPKRSFGAPMLHEYGVKTGPIYDLYEAEGKDVQAVMDWYELPESAVRDAIEFEHRIRTIAA